ncbi:hypothetical protein [Nonomuraea ceibae]|uniref:hypothetical protein n=1 Tax=Nonomuraea ceibae TaxID=1935170 RepID=UPI001C5EED35|nr:hypothetical protein [Nonomuraea ceibae]
MAAKNFSTKKVTEDGQPVMVVKLLAMHGNDSSLIKFNLPGEQHHLTPGMPVRVEARRRRWPQSSGHHGDQGERAASEPDGKVGPTRKVGKSLHAPHEQKGDTHDHDHRRPGA